VIPLPLLNSHIVHYANLIELASLVEIALVIISSCSIIALHGSGCLLIVTVVTEMGFVDAVDMPCLILFDNG